MVEIAAEVWWFTLKCKLCDTDYVGKTQWLHQFSNLGEKLNSDLTSKIMADAFDKDKMLQRYYIM